jgi:hypothetical protein
MANLIERSIREVLAYCDLTLVRSERLSRLLRAEELLPEAGTFGVDFAPDKKIGNVGFSLNIERQLSFLGRLSGPRFQDLFGSLRADPNINVGFMGKNYREEGLIHNGYFPTPDAELYAAFIAEYQPTHIVEIGSGYSTLIAHHTVRHLGISSKIHVIDPQPRRDVANYASQIEYKRVQNSSLTDAKISKNERTILFIDSSHITKMGGDIPFLYCQILPNLPVGVLIHVHDIFTPFDYPVNYGHLFYTEQYVLQALLANSSKFSVLFSAHAMSRGNPTEMQAVFGPQVGSGPLFFGASFWMETVA